MMKVNKLIALTIAGLTVVSCKQGAGFDAPLTTKADSVNYALGVSLSGQAVRMKKGLKKDFNLDLNTSAFIKGFEQALDSTTLQIDLEKGKTLLQSYFENQKQLAAARKADSTGALKNFSDATISSDASLKHTMDSISYALGVNYSTQVKLVKQDLKSSLNFDLNQGLFLSGYASNLDSVNVKIDEAGSRTLLTSYFKEQQEKAGEKNKAAGDAFIAANKTKEGVVTTESGLQYQVIKKGTGKSPKADSKVKVHYEGTLIDGTVFDSSIKRGKPTEFGVSQVIKGWTEGLQLMKEGGKYKFFIPQDLAYGARPAGQLIKPYSALVFEVELLEVK